MTKVQECLSSQSFPYLPRLHLSPKSAGNYWWWTQIADFEKFEDLLEAPWQVTEIFDDLEDAYDYWKSLFDSIANEHAPTRKNQVPDKEV